MNITISDNASQMIKTAADNNRGKLPVVYVLRGGCAGYMLGLTFLERTPDMALITVNEIIIAISKEVVDITNDISIDVKNGILPELVVKNNAAQITCKCGKSFKL